MGNRVFDLSVTAALALGLAGSAACNRTTQQDAAARTEQAVERAAERVNDGWITTKIQAQFFADSDIKARRIDVTTENGIVTLKGNVPSEAAKAQAVALARRTDGVKEVRDQLQVIPEGEQERAAYEAGDAAAGRVESGWITTKIQAKYFAEPQVKGRNIDVTTVGSEVTLRGRVDSEQARRRAVEIARATEGVTAVHDELRVAPDAPVATGGDTASGEEAPAAADRGALERVDDAQITARILSKFFLDDEVKGRRIDVDTRNGVVTLSGEVQTASERQQALALARNTPGVSQVVDRLEVRSAAAGTAGRQQPGATFGDKVARGAERAGDQWIATKVQAKFFLDDQVKGGDVKVEVRDGIVTLSGTVPSAAAKQQAVDLARHTDGVTRVVDRLSVAPATASR